MCDTLQEHLALRVVAWEQELESQPQHSMASLFTSVEEQKLNLSALFVNFNATLDNLFMLIPSVQEAGSQRTSKLLAIPIHRLLDQLSIDTAYKLAHPYVLIWTLTSLGQY